MDRAVLPPSVGVPEPQPPPARRRGAPSRRALALLVPLLVLASVAALWRFWPSGPAPITRADVERAVQSGISQAAQQQRNAPPDAATAYRTIQPSLVTVTATGAAPTHAAPTGAATPAASATAKGTALTATGTSLGAGVVVNSSGAVLTALHVVAGSSRIQVQFADGTTSSASIGSSDPATDIAVLQVSPLPSVVVPAVLAGAPGIGDAVFPVGNPLGLRDTLTAGVVSAVDRSVDTTDGRTLHGLIQFDAAVNPGNSGGPLLDRSGHVVGIVTGLANPSEQAYFVGVGFAVPIATAGGLAGAPLK